MKVARENRSLLDCKKGQWLQFTFVVVILIVVGLIFFVLTKFGNDINTAVQDDGTLGEEALVVLDNHANSTSSVFDAGVMVVLVGVWLLCLGLAYNSGSSPFLLVVALFIIVALGFVGMILSNMWSELSQDVDFVSTVSLFPMTNFVLSNYLVTVLVIGFTTIMVSYGQRGGF